MSVTSPPPSGFRFLDLPPELRQYVYRFTFEDHDEWRRNYPRTSIQKHTAACDLQRMVGKGNDRNIFMTIPSGPVKLCSMHKGLSGLGRYSLPFLLHIKDSIIGSEAASLYFSLYTITIPLFWKLDATGSFGSLPRVLKQWNLPDCRIIKHLTLSFIGRFIINPKRNNLDDFYTLAAWTHFIAKQESTLFPELLAVCCVWSYSFYPSPWLKTNTLLSTWPKLMQGLQILGRQIRQETLKTSGRSQVRLSAVSVQKRVRLWIDDWQNQDDFVNAKKDLLRSWAAVAKFSDAKGCWAIKYPTIQSDSPTRTQEEWDVYLEMPWSKPSES